MDVILGIIAELEADLDAPRWLERAQVAVQQVAERLYKCTQGGDDSAYLLEAQERLVGLIRDYGLRHREWFS